MDKLFKDTANLSTSEGKVKMQLPVEETEFAWKNYSRFSKTANVARDGQVKFLPEEIDESIMDIEYMSPNGKETVKGHLEKYPVEALVVVKDGKIVTEYYNGMKPTDKHIWFSCSKIIGSTIIAKLKHEGKIDTSKPIPYFIPELKGSAWDNIPLDAALDMATGLNGTEHDEPQGELYAREHKDQIWYQWAAALGMLDGK